MKERWRLCSMGVMLIMMFSMVGVSALAQSEKGTLYLSGKVVNEKRRGLESTIYIFKDEELVQEIPTSKIGKFELEVSMQDSVAFVVYAEGYVTKTIVIDSRVHPSKQKKDHVFACFIDRALDCRWLFPPITRKPRRCF